MWSTLASVGRHPHLLVELTKRELRGRYARQALGTLWAWLHPLFLMLLYTTIFNFIFAQRFGDQIDLPRDFTTYVLAGLVPWLALQDVLARSPGAFLGHAGFIKQAAFPIEILPVMHTLTSLPIFLTGAVFLVLYMIFIFGNLPLTLFLWPIYILLFAVFSCGIVFMFGALGVFLRDLREVISVFTAANLFLTPILFVPDLTPKVLQTIFLLNPFSYVIWPHQDLVFYGRIEHPSAWLVFAGLALGSFVLGIGLFQRLRVKFGDAI